MDQLAGKPHWELTFDKDGTLTSPDRQQFLQELSGSSVTDLFVMSHGWGSSVQGAQSLYSSIFPMISDAAGGAPGLSAIGFVGVFWPSLLFPDPPPNAAAQVARAVADNKPGAADAALTGKEIADTLAVQFPAAADQAKVQQLGSLIDEGTAGVGSEPDAVQQQRVATFHQVLSTLVAPSPQPVEDSGESALLQSPDPQQAYQRIADIMGSAPADGSAQGIGDIFGKIWNGAKDALRTASYYEMKARAGNVGKAGLGPLLEQLHTAAPTVRVHLIGHSFGARLVSFSLQGISGAAASPVATLSLIQGAFSHWSFAGVADMPFGQAGALNGFADRVQGPMLSTFSQFDWAVGRWYPRASFLADQDAEAGTDPADQWGGLGSDGFQGVSATQFNNLQPTGTPYPWTQGGFHRVDGSNIIADVTQSSFSGAHSDIEHPEVAWIIVSSAASTAPAPSTVSAPASTG